MVYTSSILDQKLISLSVAARRFPGRRDENRPVNGSTIFRWVTKGVKSTSGKIVKLRATKAGSRWFTTEESLCKFCEELSAGADVVPAPRSPTARNRASERAAKELESMGA